MAGCTILSYSLVLGRNVGVVMAAETAREVCMAQVVWIRAPGHLQITENVLPVDLHGCPPGLLYLGRALTLDVGIRCLVVIPNLLRNLFFSSFGASVCLFQHCQ